MYKLEDIIKKISPRTLSRKEQKHYLKYHLKAFASIHLGNKRKFDETEFNKIVNYLKNKYICTSCSAIDRYSSSEGWFDEDYNGPKFFLD